MDNKNVQKREKVFLFYVHFLTSNFLTTFFLTIYFFKSIFGIKGLKEMTIKYNKNKMNQLNFSLDTISNLSQQEAKQYLIKYIVPLTNGSHAMLKNGKYEIIEDQIIKKTIFKRLSQELNKYYFVDYHGLKTIDYKINKPLFYDDILNLCPKLKHTYQKYELFDDAIKLKVNIVLSYIKEIICNDKDDHFKFVLQWLANMTKGNKNNSCIYLKGIQGIGKSTLPLFMSNHVIGKDLSLETGSKPLKSNFNQILGGKLFVVFEELENFSINDWSSISSVLKRIITSNKIELEGKGTNAYETENINNYLLCSNNDAIKDDEGRRFYIADLSTKRLNDSKFFDELYSCMTDDIGHAFYCYLLEIDTENFNPQSYPITKNKLNSISKRLDTTYQFLKEEYILKKLSIKCTVTDLYNEYVAYCNKLEIKPHNKIDFNTFMTNINITYYKSNSSNKYKISFEDLHIIAKKSNWIHELDEFKDDNNDKDDKVNLKDFNYGIVEEDNQEITALNKRIQYLENQLKEQKATIIVHEPKVEKLTTEQRYEKVVNERKASKRQQPINYEIIDDDEIDLVLKLCC